MNMIHRNPMRHALAILATGLALGGLFAPPAQAGIYQLQSNYVAGTVAPYNGGGGVPAQALMNAPIKTPTNCTFSWYGMKGWSTIYGSTNMSGPFTNVIAGVEATNFGWTVTAANPDPTNNWFFVLSQSNYYSGQGNCSGCHGDKYAGWSGTPHAGAYNTLLSAVPPSVAFGAGCILCHSVGYGQPSGFTDIKTTPGLANVGCENCHGPAGWHKDTDHAAIKPAVSMDPAICGSCHIDSHHPTYTEYTNATVAGQGLFPGLSHSHPSQSSSTGCAVCHSANNRMVMLNEHNDSLNGKGHALTLVTGSDATLWSASCATCHDPHGSNQVAQLRYPTHSTNWFTMPTTFDARTVATTNELGAVTTASVNLNTVFDTLYNTNVQVCGQCHNTRDARWDGNPYSVLTNTPIYGPVTTVAYVDTYCTNVVTQVFTNSLGVPYLTNTYTSITVCGRYATTNVVNVQTNPVYSVGVITSLLPYTNGGVVSYSTNSSGYGRAPHFSPQYNILIGSVDYDYAANAVANKTHAHSSAPDQCITCHVPNYAVNSATNVTGHNFTLDYYGCLATCHSTYTADALTAKINNLQFIETNNMVRVASLLNQWALNKTVGTPLTNYAQMAWEYTIPGGLSSPDAQHASGPPSAFSAKYGPMPAGTNDNLQLWLPQDIRLARYDLYMAYNDQSIGVHNPSYVQALLDDAATRVSRQFTAANFTAGPLAGFAPLTVAFTNLGAGITASAWNFGDGVGTSLNANPTYQYTTPGIYSVTYTATTASGTETLLKTNYIRVLSAPTVSFTADNVNVAAGTTVNFTSTSTGTNNIFRWAWYPRFGVSGASSYAVAGGSPFFSFTYTNPGVYSVELAAYCPGGANSSYNRIYATNVNYINVVGANFYALATNVVAGTAVSFTNKSGGATSYVWSFGDGNTSTSANPVNIYTNPGTYTVTLAATNNGVGNTLVLPNYIVVNPAPVASFTGTPTTGLAPLTVSFNNASLNATAYVWNFGDGHTSTNANPSNTYANVGTNTVTLQAIGSGATNILTLTNYVVAGAQPLAAFTASPTNGWSPLTVNFTNASTSASSYVWNFGDGTTSTSVNPVHTYTATNSGPYTVTLQAINFGVTNTKTIFNCIHVAVH